MKRKAALFLLAALLAAAGCGSGSTAEDAGTTKNVEGLGDLGSITVVSREEGSGTRSTFAAPLMEALAAAYGEINPNASVEVTATDSTDGLTAAMQGQCSFGMASRELESYEKELLDYALIAKDGIAVIVNDDNPLTDISTEDLKEIYTGEIDNWEELNS